MTKVIKQRWNTVLKSGSRALEVVRDALDHVKEHGDTSLLSHMIHSAETADMKVFSQRVRLIVKAVYPEAKLKKTKDGGVSITRGDAHDEQSMLAINAFVDAGVSLIGAKVQERFGAAKVQESTEQLVTKRVKADAKFILSTDGISLDQYISQLRTIYAQEAAVKMKAAS